MSIEPQDVRASDVSFLPIIAAYVKKLGIVDQVDRLCPTMSDVSAGQIVMALILDTLAGRSPLYKLELSFVGQDTELLFGEQIAPAKFNDDAVGRSMDALFEVGTGKILTAVVLSAIKEYNLDTQKVHHDTTSVTVYGDYDLYQDSTQSHPFVITRGFNKDHRPDLKQIIQSLVCVDRGIPVAAKMIDGNRSDKIVNRNLLVDVAKKMKELGQNDPVYVADSALVTEDNLDLLADEEKGCRFITRLPRTYNECRSVVSWAVENNAWNDIGIISAQHSTPKRKPSYYHGFETEVDLYGKRYRSLVVHSDALDKKSVKKFEREIERDRDDLTKMAQEQAKIGYACLADAHSALERLHRGKFHCLSGEVYEVPHYPKGRPKAQTGRTPTRIDYRLALSVELDEAAISRSKREAGCFVLLTNIPNNSMSSYDILSTYKAQDMVERNFGFLKDEAIVNSLFLKTPARIEVLGLVLVLSLMVWRLMERTMRLSLKSNGSTVQGWDKKPTSSPTSLMITAFFMSMVVIRTHDRRFLANGLSAMQSDYLKILNVSSTVFTDPHG
ncbi:MAG: IS1634 family transposase [Candidatus Acidifodinimicrobium sp.]